MLNLIQIGTALPGLNQHLPVWWHFSTSWLMLSAVSVKLILYICICLMLSTLSLIIFSSINWAPSDSLMLMLAGFTAT
jgi:hypothetical protein